jgi:Tol biopolymer transport system component
VIGQTISHYTILEKLGEGGMGVVYKAHDTELDRDVALKFLPNFLTGDAKERERFHHEARAASALNHPNVSTIYEIKEFEHPAMSGRQLYLAMEYVEGRTFRDIVTENRAADPAAGVEAFLTMRKILDIAIQACEGLAAAHEKRIVHRDIKSANLMLTPKGQVKIMDFGLAKVQGATKLTQTGSTIGTAAYMSPEQARGEEVDHRSDIFSFGVVFYELITARLPFSGEHPAALMFSIVNEEPQPPSKFNEKITPEMERIVAKALAKEKDERYQHVDDLLADLRSERKKLEYARTGYSAPSGTAGRAATGAASRRRRRNVAILGMALVLVTAAIVFNITRRSVDINPDVTFRPLKLPYTDLGYPGISGDGNWIAFGATDHEGNNGLYIMHSSGGELRQVTSTKGRAITADFSRDGRLIAYCVYDNWTRTYGQYVIDVQGGRPVNLGVSAGSWRFRPDGQRLGYIRGIRGDQMPSGRVEFWSMAIDGSDPRREFIDSLHVGYDLGGASSSFSYSPDGKQVGWVRSFPGYSEVIVHDLESGEERSITSDKCYIDEVAWLREDKIAYTTERNGIFNVWITSVGGSPVQVTRETTSPPKGIKATADGRRLLYLQKNLISDLWIVDIATNRPRRITFGEDLCLYPQFSPDGKQIAFEFRSSDYEPWHIAVMDRDGRNRKQISFGDEVATDPVWSTDGRWIAYQSRKMSEPEDSARTYVFEPSNPGAPKFIANGQVNDWIDSTRFHVFVKGITYVTSIDRAPLTKVYDDSTLAFYTEGGRHIIYLDRRKGKDPDQWWIVDGTSPRDVQQKTARRLVKSSGLVLRGNTCYWLTGVGEVWRMTIPDGKPTRIQADFLGVDNYEYFSPSRDGKEVIIGKWRHNASMVIIENLFE